MSKLAPLSGFNNLTKVLSFNLYDFCLTLSARQRDEYIDWINQKYSSHKICQIAEKICSVIKADVLNVSTHDYQPVGASTLVLMSDLLHDPSHVPSPNATSLNMHLDKSHITAHTYPDANDPDGVCSFRVDIDIATCGEIIPLTGINILFEAFECDVAVIDYVVRGYTRLADGRKIYNDQPFDSIQEFIRPDILETFASVNDCNMKQANTWQTKLMIKDLSYERYLMDPRDVNHPDLPHKMNRLVEEMHEVYSMLGQ